MSSIESESQSFHAVDDSAILARDKTKKNYDDVMDRIGFGRYQMLVCLAGWCIMIPEGIELFSITIICNILMVEFDLSSFQEMTILVSIFVGFFTGSTLSAVVSAYFTKKDLCLVLSGLMAAIAFGTVFVKSYFLYLLSRLAFGLTAGFIVPVFSALALEFTPAKYRGVTMIISLSVLSVGSLVSDLVYLMIVDNLYSGSWIWMYFLQGVFSLIGVILIFVAQDSPRGYLVRGQFEESFNLINKIGKLNRKSKWTLLSEEEKTFLIESVQKNHSSTSKKPKQLGVSKILQGLLCYWPMFTRATLLLFIWTANGAIYYGILYAMPEMISYALGESATTTANISTQTLLGMIPSLVLTVAATIAVGFVIEIDFFGRKKTMIICNFLTLVCSFLALIGAGSPIIWVSIIKFLISIGWNILYPYSGELFPTNLRIAAIAIMNGLGRLGAFILPTLMIFFDLNPLEFPLMLFIICSGIAVLCSVLLPYDTCGKKLEDV